MRMQKLAGLAAVFAVVGTIRAAEPEQHAPQMYYIYKEVVRPSMTRQYEEATRDLVQTMKDAKVDGEKVNFMAVYGPEMGYTYVVPLDGFAGMDTMRESWGKAIETIGEAEWKSMARATDQAVERRESFHVLARPDLSHWPEKPRVPRDEVAYISYAFYYVIPGKEEELEAVARDYAALYAREGLTDSWTVYQSVTGNDLPLYVVTFGARDHAGFAARQSELDAALGAAAERMGQRAMACVRRVDKKEGWLRPDLSYPTPDTDGEGHDRDGHDGHGHAGHDHDH